MKLLVRYLGVVLVKKDLEPGEYVIGRSPDADILLTQDFISREHGKVYFENDAWWYQDLRTKHPRYHKSPVKITDTAMHELENDIDLLTETFLYAEDTGNYDIQDLKSMAKKSLVNRRTITMLGALLMLLCLAGGAYLTHYLTHKPMDPNALLAFARPMVVELERIPNDKAVSDFKKYAALKDEDFSDRTSFCSGFVIAPEVVLTASHCVHHGSFVDLSYRFTVNMHDGKRFEPKRVLGFDAQRDFLFLEVPGVDGYGTFEFESQYDVGQAVYTIGNVMGEGIAIRDGILASTTADPNMPDIEYLRFSAAASPGNSGGPLVDGFGRVVGIVFAGTQTENYNVATAAEHLVRGKQRFVDDRQPKVVEIDLADKGRFQRESLFRSLGLPFSWKWRETPELLDSLNELKASISVPSAMQQHAQAVLNAFDQATVAAYSTIVQAALAKDIREASWDNQVSDRVPVIIPSRAAQMWEMEYLRQSNGLLAPTSVGFSAPASFSAYEQFLEERDNEKCTRYPSERLAAQLPDVKDRKGDQHLLGRYRTSPGEKLHLRQFEDSQLVVAVLDWGKRGEELESVRQITPQLVLEQLVGKEGLLADTGYTDLVRPKAQRDFTIEKLEEPTVLSSTVEDDNGRKWTELRWTFFDGLSLAAFCQPLPQGSICALTLFQANNDEWLEVRRKNYIRYELSKLQLEPQFWSVAALLDYFRRGYARGMPTMADIDMEMSKSGQLTVRLKSLGLRYVFAPKEVPDMLRLHAGLRLVDKTAKWIAVGFDAYFKDKKSVCSAGVSLGGASTAGEFFAEDRMRYMFHGGMRKKDFLRQLRAAKGKIPHTVFGLCSPLREEKNGEVRYVVDPYSSWKPYGVRVKSE